MKEKNSTKRYPRKIICETQMADDGCPLYRRRKPEKRGYTTVTNLRIGNKYHKIEIHNPWVVLYSPILSKMFQAHTNVEYCNSLKSIKYFYKYIYKGSLGLPVPTRQEHHTLDRDLLRGTNYDINILQHMVETSKPRLTEDQLTAYEAVMNFIAEGNLELERPPCGTEKTFLINFILD
ncbi:hypothetical protein AVEN_26111-1 [Araneus ventricosus]|uniref:Helitron helicase-like domain-containing protein n=1 Tax=Araneus ventricosus TaxID=182803 RepID=A0A4Y2Q9F9_ARAVE|nr:hypothetical protein AVEN_26111-1 [Araneus ventricosus]